MYPELFEIPFIHLTVKSYGLMMVIGFLSAVFLIRRLSRNITPDPQLITNAALYSLIAGVVGARLFFIVHYFDQYLRDPLSVFAIWEGGLELLGGVILAIIVIFLYLWHHKLPIRRYLDILAIGLMLALVFGRIGCFLNGCCFGIPTNLPWAVRFPYGSHAYRSQVNPDIERNRPDPQLELPLEFFRYVEEDGLWYPRLKPYQDLTQEQKYLVDIGPYRCLPVHPTQLYSSVNGAVLCLILYLFWRRTPKTPNSKKPKRLFSKPGCTFGLMFVVYGITRFLLEFLRDDNPFEFDSLTVSQNISIAMILFGAALMVIFEKMKPKALKS
ncbi:MAG: prolipoprotein diacylglyceryl transferase [Planctomycetota bacterium]|jgi:phosphatidylglycerol:prolipoprotein diacylglycerol transferase